MKTIILSSIMAFLLAAVPLVSADCDVANCRYAHGSPCNCDGVPGTCDTTGWPTCHA